MCHWHIDDMQGIGKVSNKDAPKQLLAELSEEWGNELTRANCKAMNVASVNYSPNHVKSVLLKLVRSQVLLVSSMLSSRPTNRD